MASKAAIRAEDLAAQFTDVNSAIIDAIAGSSDDQWRRETASEEWPVAVVAHHVAEVQRFFAGVLRGLGEGPEDVISLTSLDIDENNAAHARQFAGVGKDETLALLERQGKELARLIGNLDETQLQQVAFSIDGQDLTGEQVVEFGVVGHFREHLESIRATLNA